METREGLSIKGCLGDKARKVGWGEKVVGCGYCAGGLEVLVNGKMLEMLEEEVM